eukprot:gene17459-biopygen17297
MGLPCSYRFVLSSASSSKVGLISNTAFNPEYRLVSYSLRIGILGKAS